MCGRKGSDLLLTLNDNLLKFGGFTNEQFIKNGKEVSCA